MQVNNTLKVPSRPRRQILQESKEEMSSMLVATAAAVATATTTTSSASSSISATLARPPFATVIRSNTSTIVNVGQERRFEEWRRRNVERMKRMNVQPKVYIFCRSPRLLGDKPPSTLLRKSQEVSASASSIRKLAPFAAAAAASRDHLGNRAESGTARRRRKKFTKYRQREKSNPRLTKVQESTSSEEDSGVSLVRSDASDSTVRRRSYVAQQPWSTNRNQKRKSSKGDSMERLVKELVSQVLEHSLSEVTKEERHMGELAHCRRIKI